jgi:hypothetical protein
MISKILLWLFVMALGVAFGAGVYESRVAFPQWLLHFPDGSISWDAAAAQEANSGLQFWFYVTIPLSLLTIANLIAAWLSRGSMRKWWLAAAIISIIERIFTFAYFIPTMYSLVYDQTIPQADAVATALQWGQLNYIRHALTLIAWLAALRTFSQLSDFDRQRYSGRMY